MNDKENLLTILNLLLADELTAINQLMVHSQMCENLGYSKLHLAIQKQAQDEMLHAERLIERILSLNGSLALSQLSSIMAGRTVSEIVNSDNEADSAQVFTNAIELASEVHDQDTVDLLMNMLNLEKGHLKWAGIQREQIKNLGLDSYLVNQTEKLVA
jgi:bacterioferritin